MAIWEECDAIKPLIYKILQENLEARDSDCLLIAMIWENDLKKHDSLDLIGLLKKGQLTNTETIRRTRQLLQEHNEELRGELYEERQKMGRMMKEVINDNQLTLF